ncbi:hypothetical protein R1flu_004500 [Riccia fluitans]|uniref:EF-hand domain-containing protein n=1 Tax=Riccia fluitans TaxID=41844 RepID=A0ABD1YQZ7_9MARC
METLITREAGQGGPAEELKKIHIVDTMPDFHYDAGLKSMYMDVVRPTDDHRLHRSSKTGLLLRDNETINGPGTLSTGDIDGAQVPPLYKFTNRGAYACQNLAKAWDDLEKSTPNVLIPEHVNKPSTILATKDITHPEDMDPGIPPRNTNPLEPQYSLPSFVEPWIPLPKFVKDSLNVEDIEGARPSSKYKRLERGNQLSVRDIEGTHPGWKPFHRRRFGEARNLNLDVADISGPLEERVLRPSSSEVYQDVEGSHPKPLTRIRSSETPRDLNLNIEDINGAHAGSGGWEDTTRRRKEFAKNHSLDEKEQKELQDSALKFLKTTMQDQIKLKQLSSKDVATTFELLDRQKSGKLDINEVNRAFKTLKLEVCPSDLNAISKTFAHPNGDGYLDYWKLVNHMVPLVPKKYGAVWDGSNNVGRSVDHGVISPGVSKSCYDPARVSDLVAGVGSGNKFLPFNGGRPITKSRHLKDPTSVQQPAIGGGSVSGNSGKSVKGTDWIKKVQFYLPDAHPGSCQAGNTSGQAQSTYVTRPVAVSNMSDNPERKQAFISEPDSGRGLFQPSKQPNGVEHVESMQPAEVDPSSHLASDVFREIPVLSALQEAEPQPLQVIKDVHFQEIVPSKEAKARKRDESLFSTFKPPHEGPPVKSSSEPVFDKLHKEVRKQDVTPLPIGGPFWPGHVETLPENLGPPALQGSEHNGPLPMGGVFWAGVEKLQPSTRASLRKDYPAPPIFSQVHSGVSLRMAGGLRGEKAQSTWVDRLGDAAKPLTFVGEGNQIVCRSGMKGNEFSRPGTDYVGRRPQSSHCPSTSQAGNGKWFHTEGQIRPQTVNTIVRGSPLEHPLPADRDRKNNPLSSRPSSSQSCKLNGCSGSHFPSRQRPASAGSLLGTKMNHRAECYEAKTRVQKKASSASAKRFHSQVREDMDTVRLLR